MLEVAQHRMNKHSLDSSLISVPKAIFYHFSNFYFKHTMRLSRRPFIPLFISKIFSGIYNIPAEDILLLLKRRNYRERGRILNTIDVEWLFQMLHIIHINVILTFRLQVIGLV